MEFGIYTDLSNEQYHSGAGISKSGLWTIHSKSPAHFRFAPRQQKNEFDFGEAGHIAVLEPERFESAVVRGPGDRRGNKWKDAKALAEFDAKLLLTSGDYDAVLAVRDQVHSNAWLRTVIAGGGSETLIEASGYWKDEETGQWCRCRPDLYRPDLGLILDVKTTVSAHPEEFARAIVNYGYHAQEAFYTDGWRANGQTVNGFAFLVIEKTPPYVCAAYELPPSIVEEGRAIMRKALHTYAECVTGQWPAYGDGVRELEFPRWAYKLTPPPEQEEAA